MNGPLKALVASFDPDTHQVLCAALERRGIDTVSASTVSEARQMLQGENVRLVFSEAKFADGSYVDLLPATRRGESRIPMVVASHTDDWNEYLSTMRRGVFDMIGRPFSLSEVERVVNQALRQVMVAL